MKFWNRRRQDRRAILQVPLELMRSPYGDDFGRELFGEPQDEDLGVSSIDPDPHGGMRVQDTDPTDMTPRGAGTSAGLYILQQASRMMFHHHAMIGLLDDDHTQYHNDVRGDSRYFTKTQLRPTAGAGVLDVGQTDGRYYPQTVYVDTSSGAGNAGDPVLLNSMGNLGGSLLCRQRHVPPDADDDGPAGFTLGGLWVDYVADDAYICLDATNDTAIWKKITGDGGDINLADLAEKNHASLDNVTIDQHHARDHEARHKSGGDDEILLDEFGTPTDVTILNATITYHGLLKKLDNDNTHYMDGEGNWTVPAGGGGSDVTSYVFITNLTGSGTISSKTYESNTVPLNKILTAAESDDDNITVHMEVHGLSNSWQPASIEVTGAGATPVTVNKQDWTQVDDSRIWTATANLTGADTTGTITATMSDGDTATFSYTRALDPPLVLTAIIDDHSTNTGGDSECPYAQTQVKQGDTLDISGTAESHADEVYVKDSDVTSGQSLQGPFTVTAGVWSGTINVGSGTDSTSFYTCYAKVTGGTAGADKVSTESVDKDQTVPTFTGGSQSDITYPGTQEALKDAETCDITVTHTNAAGGDTYLYDDNSTSELTIPNTTTYVATKTGVARAGGSYRESGTNYRLTATRTAMNGATATKSVTVKIANTTPSIIVAKLPGGTELDRMGTDDGTNSYKDHTVYLISNQANLSTHTAVLTQDGSDNASWQGTWSTYDLLRYTRSLRVEDGDINAGGQASNNYTWASCSIKNRAGKEATIVSLHTTYSEGGFETRTLNMGPITGGDPPYTHTADIGCPVVDTSKTTVVNTSKGGTPSQTYEGNVTEHNDADSSLNNYWTTVTALASCTFDDYTQYFHCSDKKFYESVTAPAGFNCTIAESA